MSFLGLQHPEQLNAEEQVEDVFDPFLDAGALDLFPEGDFSDLITLDSGVFDMDFFGTQGLPHSL